MFARAWRSGKEMLDSVERVVKQTIAIGSSGPREVCISCHASRPFGPWFRSDRWRHLFLHMRSRIGSSTTSSASIGQYHFLGHAPGGHPGTRTDFWSSEAIIAGS